MKRRAGKRFAAAAVVLLAAGLLLVLPQAAFPYSGGTYSWVWQNPFPGESQVRAVSAASATVSWGVGDYGQIYRYNSGTLSKQVSPTTNNLYGVDALPGSTSTAWAVGQAGTIIYTTDSGTTWTQQNSPTTYDLSGVAVVTASNVYAVGGYDGFTNAVILHYNGTAWSVQQTYPTGGLNDIYAYNASNIWAVGQKPEAGQGRTLYCNGSSWVERDTSYAMISVSGYYTAPNYYLWGVTWDGTVVRSSNGGVSYTAMFTDYWPASVSAVDSSNVWVVGWDATVKKYNGSTWSSPQTFSQATTTDISDVDAFSTAGQFAAGDSRFLSNTNTTTWQVRTGSVTANNLLGCVSYGTDEVWAAGAGGTIVHSANGGATWAAQTSGVTWEIRDIDAADAGVLYAAGNNRVPRKTTDGGATWTGTKNPNNNRWYGVAVADAYTVWISGTSGRINKTTNGGNSWSNQVNGVGTNILDIDCVDTNNAMFVGDAGAISTTVDGGANWTLRSSGTGNSLKSVSMASAGVAWTAGAGGTILYTTDGGASWLAETSNTTAQINGVTAIDTTHAWAVTSTGQILYRDNSSTWSVHSTPTTGALNWVFAWNASNAWAVGNTGSILFADPPYIKSCAPNHADPGQTADVEVAGGYTHFSSGTPVLDFGPGVSVVPGSLTVIDNTTLFAQVFVDPSATLGPRDVQVVTGPEAPVPLAGGFNVGSNPAITSASPGTGARGWTGDVTIKGSQTGFSSSSRADFGSGIAVNSTTRVNSERVIANVTVSPSASPGRRDVNVVTGAEKPVPLANGFTVATPPNVRLVTPSSGPPGSTVTITGTGFGAEQYRGAGAKASQVSFNGEPSGPVADWSDGRITCTVPSDVTAGPVTVSTPDGISDVSRSFSPTSPKWYLAEGSTAWGFSTGIAIINPNDRQVTVRLTYLTNSGRVTRPDIEMAPMSRTTVNPADEDNMSAVDFSTQVECLQGKTIAVDRTMSWKAPEAEAGEGHSSIGVTGPQKEWYLAEGSSAWDFECWLLIMNPSASQADCNITYMIEGQGPVTVRKTVPARTRASFNIADDIGQADASIRVVSDVPVIPERAMYRNNRREGHDSTGVSAPSNDFYLAEGSTAWGFTTYILVENPNAEAARVTITYMTPSGEVRQPAFDLAGLSRRTVRVNDVAPGMDLSTHVRGSVPIVAERSMYWNGGTGEACHDSIGVAAAQPVWYLADGRSSRGFERYYETWTLVQNPNGVPVDISVNYLTPGGSKNRAFADTIPANSRRTYNMADWIEDDCAGIVVRSHTAGENIIVERSMYWDERAAGTCTIAAP